MNKNTERSDADIGVLIETIIVETRKDVSKRTHFVYQDSSHKNAFLYKFPESGFCFEKPTQN